MSDTDYTEYFDRFERAVDTSGIKMSPQLEASMRSYSGNWKPESEGQTRVVEMEARRINAERERLGKKPIPMRWKGEVAEITPRKLWRSRGAYLRKQEKLHYTVVKIRGRTYVVGRVPKGQAGAGRFVKYARRR